MATWQPVQVTYKAFVLVAKVCDKRWVSKGARSIKSGYSCSWWVFTFVLFIVVRVRVNTRSSLYTKHIYFITYFSAKMLEINALTKHVNLF